MKTTLYIIMTIWFVIGFECHLHSAHILGGHMSYEFVEINADSSVVTYRILFTMYRDPLGGGAEFDSGDNTVFGVFQEGNPNSASWNFFSKVTGVHHTDPEVVEPTSGLCGDDSNPVAVEKASYIFDVQLPVGDRSYMITYQRCCRSAVVTNLYLPDETGAVFSVIITPEALRTGNSSPQYLEDPNFFVCADVPFLSSHAAIDIEGDSTVYKFCSPLASGGTFDATSQGPGGCCDCVRPDPERCLPPYDKVVFGAPYSESKPFGESSSIVLDTETGLITGESDVSGVYSYSICVEEYRDGKLLGKSTREISSLTVYQNTSVENISETDFVNIYPNPVDKLMHLDTDMDITTAGIYSMEGQLIFMEMGLNKKQIDMSELNRGLYLVKFNNTEGGSMVTKFVKL